MSDLKKKLFDMIKTASGRAMVLRRIKQKFLGRTGLHYRRSYSQCGEDVIARTVFDILKIAHPTYLDIGAHDAKYLSNTYLFYREGAHGVAVEPDPVLHKKLKRARPRDVNLAVGVGAHEGTLTLNIMSVRTLNTFSEVEANLYEKQGYKIVAQQPVPIFTVNQIIKRHLGKAPDFLSVDVEGLDYEILESLDTSLYRPALICVETIAFSNSGTGEKRPDINALLLKRDYLQFADTYINTLYVDRTRWLSQ